MKLTIGSEALTVGQVRAGFIGGEQRFAVMRYVPKLASIFVAATLLATAATPRAAGAAVTVPSEPSVWQHHQATINYYGITTLYSCDALEDKVRELLLYFGTRADLKVRASGCERGAYRPSHSAWVSTDFYTLTAASTVSPDAVQGRWSAVTVLPMRPDWMGAGECELISAMKGLLTRSFSARGMDYRTSCFPHEVTTADYSIKSEVLKLAAGKSD